MSIASYACVMALSWLGLAPKKNQKPVPPQGEHTAPPTPYLITGGAEVTAQPDINSPVIQMEAGSRIALEGMGTLQKHYFCDWILGFLDLPKAKIQISLAERALLTNVERAQHSALIGRSPMLFGSTIQDALLYRTQNVRKAELLYFVDKLFGPSLKEKSSPLNPFVDHEGNPISTSQLTSREHLEVAQINLILMKTPLVVFDLSSDLVREALEQGFRPSNELLDSGKTILFILPVEKNAAWAEEILGRKLTGTLQFA